MFHVEQTPIIKIKLSLLITQNAITISLMKQPWIAAIIIATIFIVFRIVAVNLPDLANFTPITALLVCGAAFWKTNKWMLPTALAVWFISNLIINMMYGYPLFHSATLVTLLAFLVVAVIGFRFAGKSPVKLILGTVLGAATFYLITNTVSFFGDPVYAKTLDGYIQCMWTGSPLVPTHATPTWTFFRNSLVANTLGTCFFLAAMSIPSIQKATQFKLARQTKHTA